MIYKSLIVVFVIFCFELMQTNGQRIESKTGAFDQNGPCSLSRNAKNTNIINPNHFHGISIMKRLNLSI